MHSYRVETPLELETDPSFFKVNERQSAPEASPVASIYGLLQT